MKAKTRLHMSDVDAELDITREVCPMTFVRTRLMLDRLAPGATLLVRLRGAEPIRNVPKMAESLGHKIVDRTELGDVVSLVIKRAS